MMLGILEKSKVSREKGSARRLSCRSPTENGKELSKARMRARRAFFSWSWFRNTNRSDSMPWFS
jgi:hypothetical protein